MNKLSFLLLFITIALFQFTASSQNSIQGSIRDMKGAPVQNANISLSKNNITSSSNKKGVFTIKNISKGSYTITISHIGFKTISEIIVVEKKSEKFNFTIEEDLLNLETVTVTGTFDPRTKLESSTSVSILDQKELTKIAPFGTASLLKNIPGTFVDASAGEVFTRVYSRGVSASAEDDLGWYYVSIQEDGLPVSLTQHSYYSPDLFHRNDLSTQRVEAIRGGKSSITALNAPGGIYNFISHGAKKDISGEIQLTGGTAGNNNNYYKIDGIIGGEIKNNWYFNIGGHYRHDDGARNTNFTFSKGGQVKFNIIKEHKNGYFKLYGKILDDKTNRWNGVTAKNWDNPTPAFGQDFTTTSLLMPSFNTSIPDSRDNGNATNNFNPSQGVHAKDLAFGVDFLQDLGNNWSISNNIKFSKKNANWQTSISTAYLSNQDFLSYYYVNGLYPGGANGNFVYRDALTGEQIATADNSQMLTSGAVTYTGNLPNNGTMGVSAWYKDNSANEIMDQLTIRKQLENHDFTGGLSIGYSDTDLFTQGSLGYATYEPNPRMLTVTIENPSEDILYLSDENGIGNQGGLFYENATATINQTGIFINDRWKVAETTYLDLGLRYEVISHEGTRDNSAPTSLNGGIDGNPNTIYDNGVLTPVSKHEFDYDYDYFSYSVGLNHKLNKNYAIFSRFSHGNKAPELDYYFNTLSNIKGEVQEINQFELGSKYNSTNFSFTTTAFLSELSNIGFTDFNLDFGTGQIVYTPIQYNSSRTIGLEWETMYTPFQGLTLGFNGVLQNPKAKKWTVYNEDTSITDYSDNTLSYNPKLLFNLSAGYEVNKFSSSIKYLYMGEREGNIANAFQLPSYGTFDLGLGFQFTKQLSANLTVTNLFESKGLANFYGPSTFGGNANNANKEFISNNPDQTFVVIPILGRRTLLKLNYTF